MTYDDDPNEKGWKPNLGGGVCPHECKGKRVRVRLRGDGDTPEEPKYNDPPYPPGWAADGRGGMSWRLRGWAFDVVEYKVI